MGVRSGGGPRVGRPLHVRVVAGYFVVALASWVAAAAALLAAAPDVAAGSLAAPDVLLAVHLVALGFLPPAVAAGAFHVLPTLLRNDASAWRCGLALPLLCAGPALSVGIARDVEALTWTAAAAESAGFALVAWELAAYAFRAPRGRMLLASRAGVLLSTVHAAGALAFGAALADAEWRPLWGIPHERAIAIHFHLAVVGWLTLLLVTVGRTLGPMLALAPAAPRRPAPVDELALAAGLWLLLVGLALGRGSLELAGASLALAAVARFAALMARVARRHRLDLPEGPLVHLAAGLLFLAQAAALGVGMLAGLDVTARRVTAYAVSLLVGWAAGATVGHVGKLLSLSAWAWWPPGLRPRQAELYPARLALAEGAVFACGVEAVVIGALAGSRGAVAAGAAALLVSALAAAAVAAITLRAAGPALRRTV